MVEDDAFKDGSEVVILAVNVHMGEPLDEPEKTEFSDVDVGYSVRKATRVMDTPSTSAIGDGTAVYGPEDNWGDEDAEDSGSTSKTDVVT